MSFPMSEGFVEIARREGTSLGFVRWAFMWVKGHVGRRLIYEFLLPRCDHVFAQSETMAGNLCQRGIRVDRVSVVPMGVDVRGIGDAQASGNRPMQDPSDGPVIAYLGSLDRARGLDFLLQVLVRLRERFPTACLRLVGDANEEADRQWLKARAKALDLEGAVVWTGWVPRAQAWSYVKDADVAVSLVPRGELFDCSSPTKVVEYLALGVPVVANDLPDQHQVLTESGAGISAPTSVPEFAAAITRILDQPALASAMRKAGPPYVESHRSYAVIGERVAATYRRLLALTDQDSTAGNAR
jgi:glycosyltransferase involved in cell wall biosynthesis